MEANSSPTTMRKTLGLTGVTVNAMALIAPGAFLWITFQLQAAAGVNAAGMEKDIWSGVFFALIIAFLTALSFAELARKYPEAGAGGSYYFADKAFLDREKPAHRRFARISKFVVGWAAHLFYWVYPGVMVAMMATLVSYLCGQFGIAVPPWGLVLIAAAFSAFVGFIAVRGINGSTVVSLVINIIQLVSLVGFSVLAIAFRLSNPLGATEWVHPTAVSVVLPHNFASMLFQSTIAILILVGFESATSLAAEAKNPKRDIPRGVILSLAIQGLFAYLLQYFAANFAISEKLTATASDGTAVSGMEAAAASGAPIGDLVRLIGDAMLGGNGFALMIIIAFTVALAVLGTTLAAMNTAVRISFAMAQDKEMPGLMGILHGRYATPYIGIWLLVAVSAVFGAVGSQNVTALTGITLASNFGTFVLYALICALTFIAFAGRRDFRFGKHLIVPGLGLIGNVGMLLAIAGVGLASGGTSQAATVIGLGIAALWALASGAYLVWNSRAQGKAILPAVAASES
ncbi:MAG: APC family permease [Anaerolineales bacterium]|nr:APC family permease [Anaerolineales bacterium]